MVPNQQIVLALDVGERRIGVAVANTDVKIAQPLMTLINDVTIWDKLHELFKQQPVSVVVVGLPRGLEGQTTAQTKRAQDFMQELHRRLGVRVVAQDEAATSLKAEAELRSRGKPYEKSDIDALAATYILEDYLLDS